MMKYSEPVSLHGSDDLQTSTEITGEADGYATVQEGSISLPQLWEYVVCSKTLPDGFDLDAFLSLISQRLRNPEWEVRQHALRVLVDFIPLIDKAALDPKLQTILDDVVTNLGHVGPAVRKGTVDALKTYILNSARPDGVLRDLVDNVIAKPHVKVNPSVTLGAIIAVPFLITRAISKDVVAHAVFVLLDKLNQSSYQETTLRALLRVKGIVGSDKFLGIIEGHRSRREFEMLCELYNLPEPSANDLDGDMSGSDDRHFWNDHNLNVVNSFDSDNFGEKNEALGKMIEDRVILETEIKLESGSAITMKIHEESGENSLQDGSDSEEETRGIRTFKVLPDDSEDDYEVLRRTPRKVRFGGAIVKMRTPDNDSNHPSDEDRNSTTTAPEKQTEIRRDAAKPKPKSHIPVPISNRTRSVPTSPKIAPTPKQYKSSPDLSKTKSRIPRRYVVETTEIRYRRSVRIKLDDFHDKKMDETVKVEKERTLYDKNFTDKNFTDKNVKDKNFKDKNFKVGNNSVQLQREELPKVKTKSEEMKSNQNMEKVEPILTSTPTMEEFSPKLLAIECTKDDKNKSKSRRNSREVELFSPIPVHNEIEVFHNLTRSPERRKNQNQGRTNGEDRHLTTADDVLLGGERSPRDVNRRKIRTADVVDRNLHRNQFVFVNNYNSFHVYNSSPGRFASELSDSPIPTRDTGDCLTCSSSGSDIVVLNNDLDSLGLIDSCTLKDIQCKDDVRIRQRGLDKLLKALRDPIVLQSVEDRLSFLLHILFSSEQQQFLQSISVQNLSHLFANLREEALMSKLHQIGLNLSKIGSPIGVRLALLVLKRISPKHLVDHLLSDSILGAKSSKVREGALQILMTVSRIFPSTEMDVPKCVKSVVRTLKDRKRKVRRAGLETLAALTQLSSTSVVLEVVAKIIDDYPDRDQLLRLIRTRLSRRQLPAVDLGGNVRYSTPCGETEIEWLDGGGGSAPPSAGVRRQRDDASRNVGVVYEPEPLRNGSGAGGKKTNYWKSNALVATAPTFSDKTTDDNESDWSRDSFQDEAPNKTHQSQIWAIDPTVFTTADKLTPINGTLRPLFVVQSNETQSASNSSGSQHRHNKETNTGYYRVRHQRGRSFSPPKRDAGTYNENERFVQADEAGNQSRACKDERFQKSFSSDQLLPNGDAGQMSLSSVSSTSTSGSSLRSCVWNKDVRSAIPIPIHSDARVKFKTRHVEHRKGPIPANAPFYQSKTPPSQATPEKFDSPPRPIMARQPFSSGSESSGYFTPPAEPHLQENFDHAAEEPRQRSGNQSNRFVRMDTPVHQENFTVIDDSFDQPHGEMAKTPNLNHFYDDTVENEPIDVAPVKRDASAASLQDLDYVATLAFGERSLLSKSVAEITTKPEIAPRKTVNSAPSLNEVTFAEFERFDATPPSSKTSLPGSVVDFQEIEVVQEVIETNPAKTVCKKTVTRQMSTRKRSCRAGKNETGVFPESLRPFNKPKEALGEVLNQLDNGEWEVTIKGLQGLVRLIRHHQYVVEAHMHAVCVCLGKHIRNLRSQVARAACLAASEMFNNYKKTLEVELEELAAPLLHRTADTNKFLRCDANTALDHMCANMSAPKVVAVIASKGASHQNAIVRCTAARLLCALTQRLGPEKTFQLPKDTRDRILSTGANMLLEGSLETRKYAKMMLGNLSSHSQYQRAMLEAVPSTVMRHISKTLKTLI